MLKQEARQVTGRRIINKQVRPKTTALNVVSASASTVRHKKYAGCFAPKASIGIIVTAQLALCRASETTCVVDVQSPDEMCNAVYITDGVRRTYIA
jgi:hypothetical protein